MKEVTLLITVRFWDPTTVIDCTFVLKVWTAICICSEIYIRNFKFMVELLQKLYQRQHIFTPKGVRFFETKFLRYLNLWHVKSAHFIFKAFSLLWGVNPS